MTPDREAELHDFLTRGVFKPSEVIADYAQGVHTLRKALQEAEREIKELRAGKHDADEAQKNAWKEGDALLDERNVAEDLLEKLREKCLSLEGRALKAEIERDAIGEQLLAAAEDIRDMDERVDVYLAERSRLLGRIKRAECQCPSTQPSADNNAQCAACRRQCRYV